MSKIVPKNLVPYKRHYSESSFWKKLSSVAVKAGSKVVWAALVLYYELTDPKVSLRDKGIILGALGYFILPLDLIPDFIPALGFTDDLGALLAAYRAVSSNITPEVRAAASEKLASWFGPQEGEKAAGEVEDELR